VQKGLWKKQDKTRQDKARTVVLYTAPARKCKGLLTLQQKKSRLPPLNDHKKAQGCFNTSGEPMEGEERREEA
jgi:hypothetical protein